MPLNADQVNRDCCGPPRPDSAGLCPRNGLRPARHMPAKWIRGLRGTIPRPIAPVSRSPTNFHARPASVDFHSPRPVDELPQTCPTRFQHKSHSNPSRPRRSSRSHYLRSCWRWAVFVRRLQCATRRRQCCRCRTETAGTPHPRLRLIVRRGMGRSAGISARRASRCRSQESSPGRQGGSRSLPGRVGAECAVSEEAQKDCGGVNMAAKGDATCCV